MVASELAGPTRLCQYQVFQPVKFSTEWSWSRPLSDITVTWNDYHHKIEQLAVQIHDSDWEFDQIVCLAKGGLRIGDIFARLFNVPLAILSASSYGGADGRQRGKLTFSRDLSMTSANMGGHVLLVDDLADSGWTLKRGIDWLHSHYGFYIEDIRAAVLWYKACSVHKPDYFVDFLEDSPWIHQPFEPYEQMSPTDLAKKLQQQH